VPDTPSNTYTCALCGGTFEKGLTDEEALAEKDALFPGVPLEDCDIVCDDCFHMMMN
jgi:hypothetical protein